MNIANTVGFDIVRSTLTRALWLVFTALTKTKKETFGLEQWTQECGNWMAKI